MLLQVPELNVQNGVLKALSFLFEYIGEMGKDYIYAVSPLLEDALMDRDLVSRSTGLSHQCCSTFNITVSVGAVVNRSCFFCQFYTRVQGHMQY